MLTRWMNHEYNLKEKQNEAVLQKGQKSEHNPYIKSRICDKTGRKRTEFVSHLLHNVAEIYVNYRREAG